MKYFHGTSDLFLNNIKKKGLLPAEISGNKNENRKKNLDKVYLTDKMPHAISYAIRCCSKHGGEPIVVEVNADAVPDVGNQFLMMRFDSIRQIHKVESIKYRIDCSFPNCPEAGEIVWGGYCLCRYHLMTQ